MASVAIVFSRAPKIWWSDTWQAFVLLVPLMRILDTAMWCVLPCPRPGQPFNLDGLPPIARFGSLIGLPGLVASLALQAPAMPWMLSTRWP